MDLGLLRTYYSSMRFLSPRAQVAVLALLIMVGAVVTFMQATRRVSYDAPWPSFLFVATITLCAVWLLVRLLRGPHA